MQGKTLLITAKNKTQQEEALTTVLIDHHIDIVDTTNLLHDGSIGITEIRLLQKNIFFKPIRGNTKACIIYNAHTLTVEAQNALLKLLEEPPDNTLIILSAENTNAFLPTVLSRCTIIQIQPTNTTIKNEELLASPHPMWEAKLKSTIAQRLKLAQDLAKNKDEAITWLENTILNIREQLINSIFRVGVALGDQNREVNNETIEQLNNTISSLQQTHKLLKTTNTNPRLTLENLFLSL